MAAMKRKFTLPSVEDLDGEIQVSRPKPLFKTYKRSSKSIEETKDNTSRTANVNDRERNENNGRAQRTSIHKQPQNDQCIVNGSCVPNQDFLSKETNLNQFENNHAAPVTTSSGSIKPTAGNTFRETFAFLEDTSHFKATVVKIKEKE